MKEKLTILILCIAYLNAMSQDLKTENWRVYYLGGQSNMDGYGYISELPDSLNKTFKEVYIFHGNPVGDNQKEGGLGNWAELKPGHGVGFSSNTKNNTYSKRFGVELSFVAKLQQLYPNEKIALIKYARGGTSLDTLASYGGSWDPNFSGINQYDHFLSTIKNATSAKDINYDGVEDRLIPQGIIWMQGESDAAVSEEIAQKYFDHLNRLIFLQRAALLNNDLPVVIGKISDSQRDEDGKVWDFLEIVQDAQEKFVTKDENAAIVKTTQNYKYSDPWHYDNAGFIDLGIQFAKAISEISKENK